MAWHTFVSFIILAFSKIQEQAEDHRLVQSQSAEISTQSEHCVQIILGRQVKKYCDYSCDEEDFMNKKYALHAFKCIGK